MGMETRSLCWYLQVPVNSFCSISLIEVTWNVLAYVTLV